MTNLGDKFFMRLLAVIFGAGAFVYGIRAVAVYNAGSSFESCLLISMVALVLAIWGLTMAVLGIEVNNRG